MLGRIVCMELIHELRFFSKCNATHWQLFAGRFVSSASDSFGNENVQGGHGSACFIIIVPVPFVDEYI